MYRLVTRDTSKDPDRRLTEEIIIDPDQTTDETNTLLPKKWRGKSLFLSIAQNSTDGFLRDITKYGRVTELTIRLDKFLNLHTLSKGIESLTTLNRLHLIGPYPNKGMKNLIRALVRGYQEHLTLQDVFGEKELQFFSEELQRGDKRILRSFSYQMSTTSVCDSPTLFHVLNEMPHLTSLSIICTIRPRVSSAFEELIEKGNLRSLTILDKIPWSTLEIVTQSSLEELEIVRSSSYNQDRIIDKTIEKLVRNSISIKKITCKRLNYQYVAAALADNTSLMELIPLPTGTVNRYLDELENLLERNRLLHSPYIIDVYSIAPAVLKDKISSVMKFSYTSSIVSALPREILQHIFSFMA